MSTLGGLLYRKNEGRESQISTNAQKRVDVHRQESPGLAENQVCRWLGAAEIYTECIISREGCSLLGEQRKELTLGHQILQRRAAFL